MVVQLHGQNDETDCDKDTIVGRIDGRRHCDSRLETREPDCNDRSARSQSRLLISRFISGANRFGYGMVRCHNDISDRK